MTRHDLVLSSSAALAKGVLTGPEQLHISYVHSPARYAWDLSHEYIMRMEGPLKAIKQALAREMMHRFRIWDMRTPHSVDIMVANSNFIQKRIRKFYNRDSVVIYPPVDTTSFYPGAGHRDEFYLVASRLVPYKRIDLIVEAFSHFPRKRLVVIGDGPEMRHIKSIASSNVEILGFQSRDSLRDYMQRARAFIFVAKEDFGIVAVEAQACGTPVIALGYGGTAETVRGLSHAKPTGVHIQHQDVKSIVDAVGLFDKNYDRIGGENCRANALLFGPDRFRHELSELISSASRAGSGMGDLVFEPEAVSHGIK